MTSDPLALNFTGQCQVADFGMLCDAKIAVIITTRRRAHLLRFPINSPTPEHCAARPIARSPTPERSNTRYPIEPWKAGLNVFGFSRSDSADSVKSTGGNLGMLYAVLPIFGNDSRSSRKLGDRRFKGRYPLIIARAGDSGINASGLEASGFSHMTCLLCCKSAASGGMQEFGLAI